MKKKASWRLLLVFVLTALLTMGTECEAELPVDTSLPVLNNELATGSLEIEHEVGGETFNFITRAPH